MPTPHPRPVSRATAWLSDLRHDLPYAARALRRSPSYTLTAIAMLALGIGINASVFTIAYSVLFKGFPLVENNDRLLYISVYTNSGAGYSDFEDWRAQAQSFEDMALVHGVQQTLSDGSGFPETYYTTEITAGTFELVGQRPLLGRDFEPPDELPGAAPVTILSHRFWERRYSKNPSVVGQTVRINGVPTTVIGIMPPGFSFPQNQDLWVPLVPTPEIRRRDNRDNWFVLGRLADGATIESARAEMDAIGRRLESEYPDTNRGIQPRVQRFHEFFIGTRATLIYAALLGAVGCVLLIACANLANLLLARAITRSREISVRVALGADRGRVLRQLLLESLLLSGIGGFCGWWIASLAVRIYALTAHGPSLSDLIGGSWFDGIVDYTMDYRVLAYLVALSIGTGVVFGLAPARRLAALDVNAALKDGARGAGSSVAGRQLSSLLVIAQTALAIVLLAGAGVMIRSFLNIYAADLGVRTQNVLGTVLRLPEERYPGEQAKIAFFDDLTARVAALPGVESVALASSLPTQRARPMAYELETAESATAETRPTLSTLVISESYFRAFGAQVLAGRELDHFDDASRVSVVIVNERFANGVWPGEDPLGKRLRLYDGTAPGEWLTVVGVAPNVAQDDFTRQTRGPLLYLPFRQAPFGSPWLVVRARAAAASLTQAVQREVQAIDPDLPMALGPVVVDEYLAWNYQYRGTSGALFLLCAGVALLLASVGLYAVIAHAVAQRTREIGVRIAIGATRRDVLTLVLKQGLRPLAIGLAAGLAAALAVNRLLASLLVDVSPADPATLISSCVVLTLSATLGCLLPARRATRVDPVVALRYE